jgi:hypothetical protein
MVRVHKNTIKAKIRRGQRWQGYITPNNVSSLHVIGGWSIGHFVDVDSIDELNRLASTYSHYNCCSELGYRVVYWESS